MRSSSGATPAVSISGALAVLSCLTSSKVEKGACTSWSEAIFDQAYSKFNEKQRLIEEDRKGHEHYNATLRTSSLQAMHYIVV